MKPWLSFSAERIAYLLISAALVCSGPELGAQQINATSSKHSVTVRDMISVQGIAGPYPDSTYSPSTDFAVFSPNGQYFAFAVSRGNLETNTTDSTLCLFRTSELPQATPKRLLTFSSASNRAPISEIRWAADGRTIYFLGSRGGGATELYGFSLISGALRELTHHQTSLQSYALSDIGVIVYAAEPALAPLITQDILKHGIHVTGENVIDLLRGELSSPQSELFAAEKGSLRERRLHTDGALDSGISDLSLSPNGQYLVVKTSLQKMPARWAEYDDINIKTALRVGSASSDIRILHYELLDTRTGKSETLLDAPTTYRSGDVMWAPDSQSVILCGTYLPLNDDEPPVLEMRKSTRFVVEVRLKPRRIVEVTRGDLRPLNWDVNLNIANFTTSEDQRIKASVISYARKTSGWQLINSDSPSRLSIPVIELKQGLNSPPEVAALNAVTKELSPFWNLNPAFAQLMLGRVVATEWKDTNGHSLTGALYLPPGYDAQRRYPLVIQTHGFDPVSFSMSGYYNTAFAAQPLASRDIVVLQVDDIFYDSLETPEEPERAMAAYESAIHELDRRQIIDPGRVGIIGFSRTSFYVKYTLTHSTLHFAAAIICDGFDAGYLQYLLFANSIPFRDSEMDAVIGSRPFGAGIPQWLKRSPGFSLEKVDTPVLIQAIGPTSLMGEWEWFSGLMRLNKAVDLLYLPTGTHVLVKPWDRMVSQGGTVDWFCFWLKGERDSVSEKAQQFTRWTHLRKLASSMRQGHEP
jgi:dipeptidyl aminopeptidase/acylaminoacyl peptidase